MALEGIGTNAVAARTGISPRQLNHWDALGIVSPSVEPAQGSGSRRRYGAIDLFHLLLVSQLRRAHLPLGRVADVMSAVRAERIGPDCPADLRIVLSPTGAVYLGTEWQPAIEAQNEALVRHVVDLGRIAEQARRLLDAPASPTIEAREIAGRVVQIVVTPEALGFSARTNAHPDGRGRGATVEEAIAALRADVEGSLPDRIRSRDGALLKSSGTSGAKTPRGAGRRTPVRGASAWGGEW